MLFGIGSMPVALVPRWTCDYCGSINIFNENCRNCGAAEHTKENREEPTLVEDYKGFKISWSGWRTQTDSAKITGFYIAEGKEISFSSCTGGIADEYLLGYVINTTILADHEFLTFASSEKDKTEEQKRALAAIQKLIDEHSTKTN